MFSNAKSVPTPKSSSKKTAASVLMGGLARYAAIDALIKNLTTIQKTLRESIEAKAIDRFVEEGMAAKARPANYNGIEDKTLKTEDGEVVFQASASIQLKTVSSAHSLSEEAVKALTEAGVDTEVQIQVVDTFVLNPTYATDMDMLAKIEAALKSVEGIPEDLFMKQEGSTKTVLGEKAIDQIFQRDSKADIKNLLALATTVAFKPTISAENIDDLLDLAEV